MEKQLREKRVVAATSVCAAILLTGSKLGVGLWTGSLGMLAEAVHSALDLAAALITFFAVRVSDKPADASHLYGHGKVENLSALAETLLLLLTCVWIIYEACHRLFYAPVDVNPSAWAFAIMGLSIVIDLSRSRALSRVAKKYKSQALEADALHFSTDIWSSAVVIVGLVFVKIGDYRGGDKTVYERADAIAALVVACIVIFVGLRLGKRAVDALLDSAPKGLADQVAQSVCAVNGIHRISNIRVREVGNQVFVDLNVDVPRYLSFEESHQLAEKAREAVRGVSPNADVMVHADPVAENEGILERIQSVAARESLSIHNISTHWTEKGMWINLDLEVDPALTFERAHRLATEFEGKLRAELMRGDAAERIADISAHIEPRNTEATQGRPLDPVKADAYRLRIAANLQGLRPCRGIQNVELHEVEDRIYLSFHLLMDAGIPIAAVHDIAERMEGRLRNEFPELGRIVIHTEPFHS